jgi:hypothetical protein
VGLIAGRVEHAGVGVEGLPGGVAGYQRRLDRQQRVARHLVHLHLLRRRLATARARNQSHPHHHQQ